MDQGKRLPDIELFPPTDKVELTIELLTDIITNITNSLGFGFQESIYQKALDYELRNHLFSVLTEQNIDILYGLINVGSVRADLIVDHKVIIEMKAVDKIKPKHIAQLERYLKATGIKKGFVINVSYQEFDIIEVLL